MFLSILRLFLRNAWLPLMLLLSTFSLNAQNSATPPFHNAGGTITSNSFPLNTTASNKVQWIFGPNLFKSNGTTGILVRGGRISKIYFMLGGTTFSSTATYSNFTIKLGQNAGTQTTMSSTTFLTGLTTVFYASSFNITGASASAWIEIPLQNPIYYNPNLSLVLEMSVTAGTGNTLSQVNAAGMNQRIYGGVASSTGSTATGLVNFGLETQSVTPNDAGVVAIDSPANFCPGRYNIRATIQNFGINQVDTVTVNWSINDTVQTPILYTKKLDTVLGTGSSIASILLANYNFRANSVINLKVWTSKPNNKIDTVNTNDTMQIVLRPSLNGTYTIGGTNPDFADFSSAATALNLFGICGPVTFNVRNGIYNERVKIDEIRGASATNTITFQSASGNNSQVILRDSATSTAENYVVQLSGADYIRIKGITIQALGATYARTLDVLSGATFNEFSNNVFLGINTTTSSTNNAVIYSAGTNDNNNLFMNNRIVGGSYGMYWYGTSTSVWENGTRIIGNRLEGQYAYGIRLFYHEGVQIRKNIITTNTGIATYYGLYLSNVFDTASNVLDTVAITENQVIRTTGGGYGFYFTKVEGYSKAILVANNFISIAGTSTSYGIHNDASFFISYHHNTVAVYGKSTSASRVFNIAGTSGFLSIYNNNFVNLGGGYTYYAPAAQTGAIDSSDYNNLYSTGSNIAYWSTNISGGLSNWQNTTLMDTNSISVNPQFASATEYTPANFALKNAAIKLATVDYDIEGRLRDTTAPDIGVVEMFLGTDVSVEALITPADNSCGSRAQQIGVVIKNRGLNIQNAIPVELVINNNPATMIRDTLKGTFVLNEIDTLYISGGINTVQGGTYSLKVYTNLAGDERMANDTATSVFVIKQAPIPGFSFNTPCFGEGVQFIDTSIVNLLGATFFWDFGDGNQVIDYNPIHIYAAPGTYNVKLVLTAANGCQDSVITPVTVYPLPVADFSAETVCSGTVMNFTDSSSIPTGNIVAYNWSFGDGDTSAMQNPTHIYANAGSFDVSLIVTSNNGCLDTITRKVTVLPNPEADFSAVNNCDGNAIQFTDSSVFTAGTIVSRTWNFGDGNTSSQINPLHLYSAPGTYNVTLKIMSNLGCEDSVSRQVTVYPNPVAAFNVSTACAGRDVIFTNNSTITGDTLTYLWNFGDGGTSNTANPVHNYTQTGSYKVTLIVISSNNCIDSVSQNVNVTTLPNPKWSMQIVEGRTVTFIPEDSTLTSYNWEYGDGNFSTRMKPTRTYTADGTYIVTLTVRAAGGCENSFTDTITIISVGVNENAAPQIGLNVFPNPFSENTTISFELEKASNISISVFDMAGKEIAKIADKVNVSGKQVHTFDAAQHNIKSGVYLLRINLDDNIITKQIISIK